MEKPPSTYTTPELVRTIRKMIWVINLLDGQEGQGALQEEAREELRLLFGEYLERTTERMPF